MKGTISLNNLLNNNLDSNRGSGFWNSDMLGAPRNIRAGYGLATTVVANIVTKVQNIFMVTVKMTARLSLSGAYL